MDWIRKVKPVNGRQTQGPVASPHHRKDHRAQTGEPHVRHQTHQPGITPVFLFTGQPGDRAATVTRGGVDDRASAAQAAQHGSSPLLRAGHAQPDVADGYLHLPAGRTLRLCHRLHGRLLAVHRGGGPFPQSHGAGGDRSLSRGGRRVPTTQGDAHRQWSAIYLMAGHQPVRGRTTKRPGRALQIAAATSDDARQSGTLLVHHLAGVPRPGPVRQLRIGPGTD